MGTLIPFLLPLSPILEGERITYHKHWVILFRAITVPTVGIASIIVAWYFVLAGKLPGQNSIVISGLSILTIFALLWFFWRFENWRNDYYVITADRIIDVNRLPLGFHTETREASLASVQNISMRIPNVVASSFGYGDVEIDTAGRQGRLVFESIAHPREVLAEVSRRIDAYRERQDAREKERNEREILDWFSAQAELERIKIVRNPPNAISAEPISIEWRVDGRPANVETLIAWDQQSRPERDYAFHTPIQMGGIGNYVASFAPPSPGKVFFAVMAKVDGAIYWSIEHWIPVALRQPKI